MSLWCECPKCSGEKTDDNWHLPCENAIMDAQIQHHKHKNASQLLTVIAIAFAVITILSLLGS